jgi:hypothetical protein
MKTHFSAIHPLFGRTNKRLPIGYQHRSPYYWWWAFLKRNEEYLACCRAGGKGSLASLYAYFGDVLNDSFKDWWTTDERGAKLFGEKPLPLNVKELKSQAEWDSSWTKDKVMVVAFPLTVSKRHLQTKFAQLLKERHDGKRGKKRIGNENLSSAKYKLERAVSIETLRIQLEVYDKVMSKQRGELDKTLAEIGADMRLVKNAMPIKGEYARDAAVKRNIMASTVSRHFKDAQRIIANTSLGKFPKSR